MWIADGWKDYEVIDTSCGEKLELQLVLWMHSQLYGFSL